MNKRTQEAPCQGGECFDYVIENPRRAKFFVSLVAAVVASIVGVLASGGTLFYASKAQPEMLRPNPYTAIDADRDFVKERQWNESEHKAIHERADRQDMRIQRVTDELKAIPRIEAKIDGLEELLRELKQDLKERKK